MTLDLLAAARDLIAANSVSANGNLPVVEILERVAYSLGLETMRQEAEALSAKQANLLVYPSGNPPRDGGLLLVTHTDTVAPGPLEAWATDPFALHVDGDKLVGLGVVDVKLDALLKLEAMANASEEARRNVAFLGTFVEEVGGLGAKHFLAERPFTPRFVACGEPSELRIVDAHKGYLVARIGAHDERAEPAPAERLLITFTGKAAHSSTPHLGVSAIEQAFAFADAYGVAVHAANGGDVANKVAARCTIEVAAKNAKNEIAHEASQLGARVEPVSSHAPRRSSARAIRAARLAAQRLEHMVLDLAPREDRRFDPKTAVFNNGVIRAHDGFAECTCDARILPGHNPEELFERADAYAYNLGRQEKLHVGIARERSNPAMSLPVASQLRNAAMETALALGLAPEPQAKSTNTEGGIFVAAGIEAIVFGPGRSVGNAHCANEWQSLNQLKIAGRFYSSLIERLCR